MLTVVSLEPRRRGLCRDLRRGFASQATHRPERPMDDDLERLVRHPVRIPDLRRIVTGHASGGDICNDVGTPGAVEEARRNG